MLDSFRTLNEAKIILRLLSILLTQTNLKRYFYLLVFVFDSSKTKESL